MVTSQKKILDAKNYKAFRKLLQTSNCKLCGLHKGRTNIVVDRGNPKAKVMMVGEGPGESEDLQGRAFVGRSGKLLDDLCRKAGFDPDHDILIGNVVRCRPPKNRMPSKKEAETCLPYLKKQIKLVNPRVIVLLGRTALQHMLPKKKNQSMKSLAGTFLTDDMFPGRKFFLLFHPAYILRDPRKKPVMLKMLKKLKRSIISS